MAMSPKKVRFVVIEHNALKAGLHWDLRIERPWGKKWDSYAVRKGIPMDPKERTLAVKTHPHNEEGALFTGTLKSGNYGAGTFKTWDEGICIIEKYSDKHYVIFFHGKKVKGRYHLLSTSFMPSKVTTRRGQETFLLFKAANQNEHEKLED